MKRILVLFAIPILLLTLVTPVFAQVGLPYTTDLIADGREAALDVGDLSIDVNGTVTFQIDEGNVDWRLEETHLYVGDEAPDKHSPGSWPPIPLPAGIFYPDLYDSGSSARPAWKPAETDEKGFFQHLPLPRNYRGYGLSFRLPAGARACKDRTAKDTRPRTY